MKVSAQDVTRSHSNMGKKLAYIDGHKSQNYVSPLKNKRAQNEGTLSAENISIDYSSLRLGQLIYVRQLVSPDTLDQVASPAFKQTDLVTELHWKLGLAPVQNVKYYQLQNHNNILVINNNNILSNKIGYT